MYNISANLIPLNLIEDIDLIKQHKIKNLEMTIKYIEILIITN